MEKGRAAAAAASGLCACSHRASHRGFSPANGTKLRRPVPSLEVAAAQPGPAAPEVILGQHPTPYTLPALTASRSPSSPPLPAKPPAAGRGLVSAEWRPAAGCSETSCPSCTWRVLAPQRSSWKQTSRERGSLPPGEETGSDPNLVTDSNYAAPSEGCAAHSLLPHTVLNSPNQPAGEGLSVIPSHRQEAKASTSTESC